MANEAYIRRGTPKVANTDFTWTVAGLANLAGRVSAQIDLGVTPRPALYHWVCECQFQATPTQYRTLDLFFSTAPDDDPTRVDADLGQIDAALADVDMRQNLKQFGAVVSENAAAAEKCIASGRIMLTERYVSFVAYNDGGASINATGTNFVFKLTPIFWQGQ